MDLGFVAVGWLLRCVWLCDARDCSPAGSCPWDSPGKNTGVGCHFRKANPDPGIEPTSPALAGKFFTESPGKPQALGLPAIKPHYPLCLTGSQSKSSLKPAGAPCGFKNSPKLRPSCCDTDFHIHPRLSYLIASDQWDMNEEMWSKQRSGRHSGRELALSGCFEEAVTTIVWSPCSLSDAGGHVAKSNLWSQLTRSRYQACEWATLDLRLPLGQPRQENGSIDPQNDSYPYF